jgi:hypothetical protein
MEAKTMDERIIDQIRRDLNLVFPNGGYSLTVQSGVPPLKLTWDHTVGASMRRLSEEVVRLHDVAFEVAFEGNGPAVWAPRAKRPFRPPERQTRAS